MDDLRARIAILERLVADLSRRQRGAFAFARSTAAPIDTGAVQTIQGQMDALSRRDAMPVLFHYGFSSAMPIGGDKAVAYLGADRSSPVVIATGHQTYRHTGLILGEAVLYDMWGHFVKLGSDGISINGTVAVTGDLHVTGTIIAGSGGGDQVSLQTHKHGTGTAAAGTVAPTAGT